MKKLIYVLLVTILLLVAAVAIIPHFISVDFAKARLTELVRQKTGRELTIAGDTKLTVWPALALKVDDVSLSNAPWAKAEKMVTIGRLDVEVELMPLFEKRLAVKRFILSKPVISLETDAQGQGNWVFAKAAPTPAAAEAAQAGASPMPAFTLGDLAIKEGRVSYADGKTGKTETVEALDIGVDYKDLESPVSIAGSAVYKGEKIDLKLIIRQPLQLAMPEGGEVEAGIMTSFMNAQMKGSATLLEQPAFSGTLNAKIASLSKLLSWTGSAAKPPVEKLDIAGKARLAKTSASFSDATITADDMVFTGSFAADFAGKPSIQANVKAPKIDLARFSAAPGGAGGKAAPAPKSEDWSREKIDFSGLSAANVSAAIDSAGLVVSGMEIGPTQIRLDLAEGALHVVTGEVAVFDGTGKLDLSLDTRGSAPALELKTDVQNVAAQKALTHFANFKKLSGTLASQIRVTAQGSSVHDFISTLNGTSNLLFEKGAIEGVDLVALAKNPVAGPLFGDQAAKTEFTEISAPFTIQNGIATNQELKFVSPVLQATGAGKIDLPARQLNFRVVPRLLSRTETTAEGQSVQKGLDIPLLISGPFSAIKVRPDMGSIVQDAIKNPENLKETGKILEDNVKTLGKDLKMDKDALKGLLKGIGQ